MEDYSELDDSFTEKLVERAKARRAYLTDLNSKNKGSMKRTAVSDSPVKHRDTSTVHGESPKRYRVSSTPEKDEKENMRVDNKEDFTPVNPQCKGLAALRRQNEPESSRNNPIRDEPTSPSTYLFGTNSEELCGSSRQSRLANLAAHINDWEDDTKQCAFVCSRQPEPKPSVNKLVSSVSSSKVNEKAAAWEEAVKAAMEENIARPPVNISKFVKNKQAEIAPRKPEITSAPKPEITSSAPKPEVGFMKIQAQQHPDLNKSLDPVDLPLSARRAFFEKAHLGSNCHSRDQDVETRMSVAQRAAMFEKATHSKSASNYANKKPSQPSKLSTVQASPVKNTLDNHVIQTGFPVKVQSSPVKKVVRMDEMPPTQIPDLPARTSQQERTEITSLVNHWENLCAASRVNTDTYEYEEERILEDQSPVEEFEYPEESSTFTSEYPEESSFEQEEPSEYPQEPSLEQEEPSEYPEEPSLEQEDDIEQSIDRQHEDYSYEIEEEMQDTVPDVVFRHPQAAKKVSELSTISEHSDYSDVCNSTTAESKFPRSMQSYIRSQQMLAPETRSLQSQSSASCSSYDDTCSSGTESVSSEVAAAYEREMRGETKSEAPLTYTVSFYRKQKQELRTPPLKQIVRRETVPSPEKDDDHAEAIQERIKAMEDEIKRQQTVIGQTSQALNLCIATAEFSGSTEQVEGERLLLIATQKRQALLIEVQRLKTVGSQGIGFEEGTGTLTLSDIQLPLKREFMAAQLAGQTGDAVHCFLCLIRHGPQVIVTQMVSTSDKVSDGALCFTNHIKLQNLAPDFSVVFEVYALQTKKENLSHDKKYHIKRDNKIRITPKGKKNDKLLVPTISSPGGPNAVRSPSFGVVGYTRLMIQNCHKKVLSLDKVPYSSPLEGVLKIKLQLHAEHKVVETGFLTMFEDISGLGAWQRRWCALNSSHISYWKFPGDEHEKPPMGVIDLKQCITPMVKLVARDVCARPHTFQLVTVRPQEKGDCDNLVTRSANTLTTTKHLLSADTKEERTMWCNKLNEALANVRKWDSQALRPIEKDQN